VRFSWLSVWITPNLFDFEVVGRGLPSPFHAFTQVLAAQRSTEAAGSGFVAAGDFPALQFESTCWHRLLRAFSVANSFLGLFSRPYAGMKLDIGESQADPPSSPAPSAPFGFPHRARAPRPISGKRQVTVSETMLRF